jgi:hypothetical protein
VAFAAVALLYNNDIATPHAVGKLLIRRVLRILARLLHRAARHPGAA